MNAIKEVAAYCGSVTTIVALITLVVKPLRNKFVGWVSKTSDKDSLNHKIDNLTLLVQKQIKQSEKLEEEMQKQSSALQASLRNSILTIYNSRKRLGYMTLYEKQNVAKLFEQYKALNGNCFVHDCVDELNNLPVKDD